MSTVSFPTLVEEGEEETLGVKVLLKKITLGNRILEKTKWTEILIKWLLEKQFHKRTNYPERTKMLLKIFINRFCTKGTILHMMLKNHDNVEHM